MRKHGKYNPDYTKLYPDVEICDETMAALRKVAIQRKLKKLRIRKIIWCKPRFQRLKRVRGKKASPSPLFENSIIGD